jgi:hypothetical protein
VEQLNKLTTGDKVLSGGALAVVIGMFLPWFKASAGPYSDSVNGFHYFLQGTVPFLFILALVAFIAVIRFSPDTKLPDNPVGWSKTVVIVAGIAGFLILTRIISVDSQKEASALGITVDRGIGLYLAFLGAIAVVVGAVMKLMAHEDEDAGTAGGSTPPTPF